MGQYVGAAGLATLYRGAAGPARYVGAVARAAWDALGAAPPLVATGNAPAEITTTQADSDLVVDTSGWASGGVAPYTLSTDDYMGRVLVTDGALTIVRFGDPLDAFQVVVTITDAVGKTLDIPLSVTVTANFTVTASGNKLEVDLFDNSQALALNYEGETYVTNYDADDSGPVNIVPPSAPETPAEGVILNAVSGYWHYDDARGPATLAFSWLNGQDEEIETGPTHTVTATDLTAGLKLAEIATQQDGEIFTVETTDIIFADGAMVLEMTEDGIGTGGVPLPLTSLPLTMTSDGF